MSTRSSRSRKRTSFRLLLLLPYELLEKIIGYCDHNSLVILLRTCKKLHELAVPLIYKEIGLDGTTQSWKERLYYSERLSSLFPLQLFEDHIDRSTFQQGWSSSTYSSHSLLKRTRSLKISTSLPRSIPSSQLFKINNDGSLNLGGNLPKAKISFPHKSLHSNPLPSLKILDIPFQLFSENSHLGLCEGPYIGIFELLNPEKLILRNSGREHSYDHCYHGDTYIPFSKSIKSIDIYIDQTKYKESNRIIKTEQVMSMRPTERIGLHSIWSEFISYEENLEELYIKVFHSKSVETMRHNLTSILREDILHVLENSLRFTKEIRVELPCALLGVVWQGEEGNDQGKQEKRSENRLRSLLKGRWVARGYEEQDTVEWLAKLRYIRSDLE